MPNTGKQLAKTTSKKLAKPKAKDLVWAGGQALLGKVDPNDTKAVAERNLVNLVSTVLKVSPFGVNILGNQPYLNNLGRKEKLEEYSPDADFEYDWKQIATDDTQKAVCFARIVDKKGKPLTPWILGEASNKTMSMSTLHGYQNHMAQTRAENRAIQHKYGVRIHHDMLAEIKRRMNQTKDEQEMKLLQQAAQTHTSSGSEEIVLDRPGTQEEEKTVTVLNNQEEAKLMKHISRLTKVAGMPKNKQVLELEKIKKDFTKAKDVEKWTPNMYAYMRDLYQETLDNASQF